MAERARLTPPQPVSAVSVGEVTSASVRIAAVVQGDRRLEASSYLTDGYGIASALRASGRCDVLSRLARTWQPNRLKGVQVTANHGTPFLAATQVFDIRPIARKWLALERTQGAAERFVATGTILVTCSGTVGRATLAFDAHRDVLISHDLLRVEPIDPEKRGWVYAFLRASKARAMMKSAHYGHMIKHLEVSHLDALPVPLLSDSEYLQYNDTLENIIANRNEANRLIEAAEAQYSAALTLEISKGQPVGFTIPNSLLTRGRRRLDAAYNTLEVRELRERLAHSGRSDTLRQCGLQAWLPNRFLRVPASNGVELVSSSALFEINPDAGDRIADRNIGDRYEGRVEPGWLLIARSGQTYGVVGSIAMATRFHEDKIVSDHVIRLAPTETASVGMGYVMVALSHPTLGRPLMKALPTGSSIPSIDFDDVLDLSIPRFGSKIEERINDFAISATRLRAEADILESEMALNADAIIAKVLG